MALLEKVTCLHCWEKFDTYSILWVSTHPSLYGDPRLGRDAAKRFLPTRFTPDGFAIDEGGSACHRVACPACHLELPRVATEMGAWIVSVIGSPAAGKSFFLGALAHTLRRVLPEKFRVSFTDSDAQLNLPLATYEQAMFGNAASAKPVRLGELIPKTQQAGELYSRVRYGSSETLYPRPFVFTIRPGADHPHLNDQGSAARLLCLYDNAGESYLAGADSGNSPVTRHLSEAGLLLFLFDPTQDYDFRQTYVGPGDALPEDERVVLRPQQAILTEAANRVRMYSNRSPNSKHDKPLFVVVTKQDLWEHLMPPVVRDRPLYHTPGSSTVSYVRKDHILDRSAAIRSMLWTHCRAIVDAAEAFAQTVVYVGVSSLGTKPEQDWEGQWTVRPCDIKPNGVETPILYGLNRLIPKLFTLVESKSPKPTRQ